MFHLTLLNAPAFIPNHLCFTKFLGRADQNRLFSFRQSLVKAAGAIWVEFPVMMWFQGAPYITAYPWAQTHPLFKPPQAAQTWWKSLPKLNCLVTQLPAMQSSPDCKHLCCLMRKQLAVLCLFHRCSKKKPSCPSSAEQKQSCYKLC